MAHGADKCLLWGLGSTGKPQFVPEHSWLLPTCQDHEDSYRRASQLHYPPKDNLSHHALSETLGLRRCWLDQYDTGTKQAPRSLRRRIGFHGHSTVPDLDRQEDLGIKVSAPQLLLNQAPVSVVILAFFVPLADKIPDVEQIQAPVLWALFSSGILASLLNLSQFLIIGRTSALTFNIISNLKNIIMLSLGWYQEGRVPTVQDTFGIFLAIGGAWAYAQMSQT